jgi:O-glycosyl hydrolase
MEASRAHKPAVLPRALLVGLSLATVVILVAAPSTNAATASASVDGSRRFQRIDGFGVNANPKNWNFSDLTPALDLLTNQMHASLWRVDIFGTLTWIDDPSHLNASYYSQIYESPDFAALWRTLSYLNSHGAQVVLSGSGRVPAWMGGTIIKADSENEFVEMITSVVDYGRRVKGIPIRLLSPLSEVDIGVPEGPFVDPTQYARIMRKTLARLHTLGYDDVRLIAPEISELSNADRYLEPLIADESVMAAVDHFGFHSYAGSAGDVPSLISSSRRSDRNLWMTEWSESTTDGFLDNGREVRDEWTFARTMTDNLITLLQQGASAALGWDAWDNVHEHCGCSATSRWGQLAFNASNATYSPNKRFYTNAQVFAFVPGGWQRIAANSSDANVRLVAFADPTSAQVTVVGHNANSTSTTLSMSLANVGAGGALRRFETNATDNMVRRPDVAVSNGNFAVDIAADTFFTFTTLAAEGAPIQVPAPAPEAVAPPVAAPPAAAPPAAAAPPVSAPAPAAPPAQATGNNTTTTTTTIDFDGYSDVYRDLDGQLPSGVIDWGNTDWYLAGPYAQFTQNSISFREGPTSGTFKFVSPRRLLQLDGDNGGQADSTVTLSCDGGPPVQTLVPSNSIVTISTGWTSACTTVTIGSTNGWETNFANLVIDSPSAVPAAPPAAPTGSTTVDYSGYSDVNRNLDGQLPVGVIDWGSGNWYLAGPYAQFTQNSISFREGPTSASFKFVSPRRLLRLDADNGGKQDTTVSLSCDGGPPVQTMVPSNSIVTISTGWTRACTTVTVGSTNGWDTNFANFVIDSP